MKRLKSVAKHELIHYPFSLNILLSPAEAAAANSSSLRRPLCTESPEISYGLNSALAGRGVIVKDKAFRNLSPSQLQHKGATLFQSVSGLPFYVRGDVVGGSPDISKPQFNKLLKQVTTHISSISDIFVHDGALGASSRCDAKVRIISDNPSAVLSLSSLLWPIPTRAISHDSRPLIIYVATSISPNSLEVVGLGPQGNDGLIAADIERSSLILCGKAFTDAKGVKESLFALSGSIIYSRGGVLLSAGLLASGDSLVILFAPKGAIKSCSDVLVLRDIGVSLSSDCAAPLFAYKNSGDTYQSKLPAACVIVSCDSNSGTIPCISKLSPGQVAYRFLAGFQDGKFVPTYRKCPSAIDPLELAKAFFSKLKEKEIPCFQVNISREGKEITGKKIIQLVQSTLTETIPPFEPNCKDLREKYNRFLYSKYKEIPDEFSF